MKFHPEELELARSYTEICPLPGLSREQLKALLDRGRQLFRWHKAHPVLHALINLSVFVFLFTADYYVLLALPSPLLHGEPNRSAASFVLAALTTGGLHSWLLYSLGVFSMHEGARAPDRLPARRSRQPLSEPLGVEPVPHSACEPRDYSVHHMSHHAKFGTENDGEFLNFVCPRRYLGDAPAVCARSSTTAISSRTGPSGIHAKSARGYTLTALVLFVPHAGFWLDRLRQYTEHNLMPLENNRGSRSFGTGFWGLLIGGGPWGSPCHWEHHLVASLPWYQQLILHRYLKRTLTPAQRSQFLLEPVVGYPRLLWRIWRESARFERASRTLADGCCSGRPWCIASPGARHPTPASAMNCGRATAFRESSCTKSGWL